MAVGGDLDTVDQLAKQLLDSVGVAVLDGPADCRAGLTWSSATGSHRGLPNSREPQHRHGPVRLHTPGLSPDVRAAETLEAVLAGGARVFSAARRCGRRSSWDAPGSAGSASITLVCVHVGLYVPRTSSIGCELHFDGWTRMRRASGAVTLSFLYRGFYRMLQLIRLIFGRDTDLATGT